MGDEIPAELNDAIERLYEVFGGYAATAHSVYCKHCVTEAEDAILRTKPLRELNASDLSRYSFKAISTWGTVEQFKYLLPRLFQLIAQEGFGYNPEILFKKPRYGGFESWPEAEKVALQLYCGAMWRNVLTRYPLLDHFPAFPNTDDCLCSVAQVVDDLAPMLSGWETETANKVLHLVDFAAENASTLLDSGTLSNAFWDERPVQMKQVTDWFLEQDFGAVFDVVEVLVQRGTLSYDFREQLVLAIKKRSGMK